MTDVGKKDKVNTATLISKILTVIAKNIAEQGKDILPTDMIGPLGDSLKGIGQEAMKKGTDLGKDVGDTLKGLFQKKNDE